MRSVAIMQGIVKILIKMREKSMEHWMKVAAPVSEKLEIEPALKTNECSKTIGNATKSVSTNQNR